MISVSRMATWLDGSHPGWHQIVDPDKLDMSSRNNCVVGQLCGMWRPSTVVGFRTDDRGVNHYVTGGSFAFMVGRARSWRHEIVKRRDRDLTELQLRQQAAVGRRLVTYEKITERQEDAPLYVPQTWQQQEAVRV